MTFMLNVITTFALHLHCLVQVQSGESDGVEPGHLAVQHAGGRHPLHHRPGDPLAGAHLARVCVPGGQESPVWLSEEVGAGEIQPGAGERSPLAGPVSLPSPPASHEEEQELQ